MTARLVRRVLGWTLVVLGVAALVLPGPGLLLLAAGLAVLSQQYEWAQKRVEPVRAQAFETARASVRSWWNIALSMLLALGLMGIGVIWGLHPPAPSWWPLDERWWLPGGWGTGSSLIGSGLVALALLIYSYRRFRGDDDGTESSEERDGAAETGH